MAYIVRQKIMSHIREQWQQGNAPVAEGLFYSDGSFRPVTFDHEMRALSVGELIPLPMDTIFVDLGDYENGRLVCPHGVVRWGGGPWEAEGWIALEDSTGDLVWLLHIEASEPFTQARFESEIVEAVAYEYPEMTVFQIPIFTPHETTSFSERES